MAGNRKEMILNLAEALYKDFGEPAVRYVREMLPGASEKQQRTALDTLAESGHPVVRKSMKDAGVPLPKAATPARRAGQSKAQAAEEQVLRKSNPTRTRANTPEVRPSLVVKLDPRLAERGGEMEDALHNLTVGLTPSRFEDPDKISVFDLEGEPFITSMSDWSAAGDDIRSINNLDLAVPVRRRGGQDYMFDPESPGSVWANNLSAVTKHMVLAQQLKTRTGKNPLFLPWGMGPTGIDFAHTPREVMLAYENASRSIPAKRALNTQIRSLVPDFKAMDDPDSIVALSQATPEARAKLQILLHSQWTTGGLGLGPARVASTDLEQVGLPALDLRNVGRIETGAPIGPSTHPSFPVAIPGHGVGRLSEPVASLSLLPQLREETGITDPRVFPVGVKPGEPSPRRMMEFKPFGGVITEDMLREIEERGYAAGGPVRRSLAVSL